MKTILNTPLCDSDIAGLKTGDIIYLSGEIVTGRDDVYKRVVQEGTECPINLRGGAIFHAGPIVRDTDPLTKKYELVSIGPTSSIRMEKWAAEFIEKTGVKIMIGKGGMGGKTSSGCRDNICLHCIFPGGCAVLGAGLIEKIEGFYWPELGMPECMWVLKAAQFGPLIVSIDTQGNNLFAQNAEYYMSRLEECTRLIKFS
jgi:L(+)-tartrate dehydratase beta subunit